MVRVRGMEPELTEFAEFYESTREDYLRIVLLNVGDRYLAQDLVAEAYTRAWVSWRKVRALEVPRAWVVRIALNTRMCPGGAAVGVRSPLATTKLRCSLSKSRWSAATCWPRCGDCPLVSAKSSRCGSCWTSIPRPRPGFLA